MSNKDFIKKIILFIVATVICGIGIAIITKSQLGTTPISALPLVLSALTPFSFGTTTFIIAMLYLLLQYLIAEERFKKRRLFQIPVMIIFSLSIDLGMHIASFYESNIYLQRLLMLFLGSFVFAFGIVLELKSKLVYVPGEALISVISNKYNLNFGRVKVAIDMLLCILAALLSFSCLHSLYGIREGTLFSALLVGNFVNIINLGLSNLKKQQPQAVFIRTENH